MRGKKMLNDYKINYLWRLCATLLGFVLFGVGGLLCKLILLPYTLKSTQNDLPRQLKARRLVGGIWLIFVKYLTATGILSVEFKGVEKLGRAGQLVLANHPSLLDVVLIISHVPHLNCVVKKDLLNNPTMNSQIRATGYIPNEENEEMLAELHQVFESGQSLLIFPEGTRTGWDGEVKMHRGAVSIGLRSAKIITPVVIKMSPLGLKKGQAWYHIAPQKMHYEITAGEDIDPQTWLAEKPLPIAARRLNDYLQNYFNDLTQNKEKTHE